MNRTAFILIIAILNVTGGQPDNPRKNGIGWDDGLAYRRYLPRNFFVGLSVFGSTRQDDMYSRRSYSVYSTSNQTSLYSESNNQNGKTYNGRIRFLSGKRVISRKLLSVNFIIFPYIIYEYQERLGDDIEVNYLKRYWFGGMVGFEPSFTLFGRFTFGSKFGVDCSYMKNDEQRKYTDNRTSSYKGNDKSYQFEIFGTNFSTNLRLYGYYEF
jgi:hypothetical protein